LIGEKGSTKMPWVLGQKIRPWFKKRNTQPVCKRRERMHAF